MLVSSITKIYISFYELKMLYPMQSTEWLSCIYLILQKPCQQVLVGWALAQAIVPSHLLVSVEKGLTT